MSWPSTWMTDSHMTTIAYISDPDIALEHINEVVARVLQYQIFYPTPHSLDQALFEAQYNEYLDADLIELANGVIVSVDPVPACGDCGGCCECLGDPPDTRWDTTYEKDEEYLETYGL